MAAASTIDEEEQTSEQHVELTVFTCSDCCLYKIPPSSSFGHRAELWDVDKWLRVRLAARDLYLCTACNIDAAFPCGAFRTFTYLNQF